MGKERPKMSMSKPALQASSVDIDDLLGGGAGRKKKKKTSRRPGAAEGSSSGKRGKKKASKRLSSEPAGQIGLVDRVGEARRRRTLYLSPDLDRRVASAAIDQGCRVSDFIAAALESHLDATGN